MLIRLFWYFVQKTKLSSCCDPAPPLRLSPVSPNRSNLNDDYSRLRDISATSLQGYCAPFRKYREISEIAL